MILDNNDEIQGNEVSDAFCASCDHKFTVDDLTSIECERCENWYCSNCCALSDQDFQLFRSVTAAHWFCHACEQKAIEAIKTDQIVEERCKKFFSETRDRLSKLEDMAVKWEKIEKHLFNKQRLQSQF